jgi:hypothetical protein
MRILIATDAWSPQVNGVVRTLTALIGELRQRGHHVTALTPEGRRSLPLPFYTEIGLTRVTAKEIGHEGGTQGLPAPRLALHDGLSHTIRGIRSSTPSGAGREAAWLADPATLPQAKPGRDGADPARGGRARKLGF